MAIAIKNNVMKQYKDALALDRQREQALVKAEQTRLAIDTPKAKVSDWQVAGETVADILGNVVVGAQKGLEGIYDFGATLVGTVGGIFDKDFQKDVQEHVAYNWTEDTTGKALREATQNSAVYTLSDKGQAVIRGVSQGVGQMLPYVAVNAITGGLGASAAVAKTAGMLTLGVSAAGTSTEEAFNEGASYYGGAAYGVLNGILEMATEKLVGGAWDSVLGKGIADSAIKKVVSGATQNKVLQKGLKVLIDSAGEGAEEMVSEIVSPYLKRLTYDQQADTATVESVVEAGLIGALTSLAYGGAQTAVKKVAGVNTVIPSELENVANYDEALKKGWDSNDKAAVERVSQAKAETLKTISQELANMSEDKRAKYIEKHNLGGMFNADGTLTDNYNNAYNGNMELARAYDTRYVSMGADVNAINSDMQVLTDNMVKDYAQKNNVSIEQAKAESKPIQVYQGELTDKAQESVAKAKKFTSKMSKIGLNNLNLVVVDENPMFNGVVVNGKNIYVGKDTFENGNWTKTIIHEVLHTNEDTETYKILADTVRKIAEGKGILNARQQEILERYQGSDQKTIDSELTALLTEELIGNEQFIDKVVAEQPNIAMRIVKKIQNLIKLFKMSGEKRAEYKVLTLAENMYLRSAYDHGRQNLIQIIEQGREDNKQVQVDEQKDEVGVDQTLALQYNEKENSASAYEYEQTMQYSLVEDKKTLDFLNEQKHIKVYRAMQIIDGELYPPMAAKIKGDDGKTSLVKPTQLGKWYQADEHPELVVNGKFTLNKGNGSSITAAYNPYWHTSKSPLNDQFSSAYKRNNLVTVECEVPESELTSGYKAEGAKDSVGEMSWHSGQVSSKLSGEKTRKVILSRWVKVNRIVPDSEVASKIAKLLEGENVSIPDNTITPSLKNELEKLGVEITKSGKVDDIRYSLKDSQGNELTQQQAEYFRDSKVRDEQGNLLVVYHGTKDGNFYTFEYDKNRQTGTDYGKAFYFTTNLKNAKGYAKDNHKDLRIKEYEVKREALKKQIIEETDSAKRAELEQQFHNVKIDGKSLLQLLYDVDYDTGGEVRQVYLNLVNPLIADGQKKYYYEVYPELFKQARENGNDGIIVKNVDDSSKYGVGLSDVYIAFYPEQIKLTTNLNPTSDQDIRYSLKDTVEKDILSHYGSTYRWTETGYILKDGTRLDLSGRRDGASGGHRTVDHREIFDIYENIDGTEAMIEFMARGNIRVSPENPGINLQVEPTEEQYRLIQDFVERVGFKEEYFSVDFDDKFGDVVETLEYNGKVSGRKVVSDIRYYFKEGKLPYRSELSQFRWSLKESFEQGLNKYSESEIASIESNKMFKVARSYEDVKKFIETSRKGTINQRLFIGKISDTTAAKIFDEIGINVVGKSLALSSADIRHIFIKHGTNGTEMTRGQVAITQENFENIIDTLIEPDTVTRSDENNMVGLKFQKEIGGRVTAITVMSEKRKALTLKSAWIQKEKQHISPPSNAEALNITSETLQSMDAVSNNSISKIEENVNPDDKNTPKYSRKSPAPSQVGDIIKAKGNLTTDKIFTKDEVKKIIADIEERLVFEDKGMVGTVKGVNELIDQLWKGLNKANKGEYIGVGVKIADYVINHTVVEDIYEALSGDVEVDEARQVIKTLKQYFHKVKISDRVLGEIKHHFDDKAGKVLALWRAKEGGLAPDQIAQEIEKTGYITSDNESQIFIEMVEAYNKAVETVNRKSEIALNSVLDSQEIYQLRQNIISAVLDGKNAYGKDSTLTKLKQQVNKEKQNYRTAAKKIYERNYAANHALYKVQQIIDLKNHRYVNSATPKADTFKAILSQLSRIKYAGNLNESGTRKIFKKINEWYTSDNEMLGYVEGGNVGATLFDAQLKADIESIANGEERKRLTVEEIRLADRILTRLYTLMVNDSRIFRAGRWVDAESKAQDYIAIDKANTEIKKTYRFAWFGKLLEKLGKWRDMILDPASVVRYHDAYNEKGFWTETYEELRKAAQDQAIMEMNFKEPIEKFLEQHKGFLNDTATREIDYRGQKIVVQNAMLLYMSFKRPNAQAGLVRNGFVVYDKDGKKIVYDFIKETTDLNEIEEIAKAQEQALYKQFNQAEKEYIALWEKAFNEDCKKAKEKTDIIRMGGSNVTDGYYVPIKRYGTKQEELGNIIYDELESLNNASFNKNTVQNSHMLLIGNLHDVGLRHINGITKYANLQIPMDNFKRLYNTDLSKFFGGENLNRGKRLGDMLDWQTNGKNGGGLEYLNDLILSMAGIRAKTDVFSLALGAIRGNTAVGVLALNPKVLLTQLSSYLASGHILSVDSLVRGATLSGKDVDGYSDLAKLRNYDGTAYLARTLTTEFTGKFAKFKENLMSLISKTDRFVIQRLFAACQVEIEKTQGLKLGSEENKIEAGKLLNKIILETQQNTIMTEKSALMRSTSELAKTATMFTSDLMKNIGRWIDAIGKHFVLKKRLANAQNATERATIEAEIKANNKQIRKSTSTMNALAVYGALVAMLFSHFFGTNDEDETLGEEFIGEFMSTWVGGIPILKDIYNYFNSGYEMQDFTLGSINDVFGGIADFANGIEKYNETGETRQLLSGARKLAFSSANAFGLPLKNLYKMTYGGINIFSPSTAYKIDDTFYKQPYSKDLAKALAKDDDIMISTITELMLQEKSGGNFSDGTREEINRLVNKLGDTSFLPKSVNQTFSFNKEQYTLTSKEFKQAKAEYEKANQKIDDLIAKRGYKTATDEEKAAMIKFVYDYYYEQTIVEAIGADKSKTLLFASGIKLEDMAIIVGTAKVIEADKDRNGNAIAGSKKKKIVAMLERQRLTADQKYLMLAYLGYSTDMERVERYVNRLRLTRDEKKALLEECA